MVRCRRQLLAPAEVVTVVDWPKKSSVEGATDEQIVHGLDGFEIALT